MTRRGGKSAGSVAGLQCGFGADDEEDNVRANRAAVVDAVLPGGILLTPYQVHSPDVAIVRQSYEGSERPRVDALVTDRPGLLLGILTADCAPVLFADREAGVVAAAHAGWRGAFGGVLANTLDAMETLGAKRSRVAAVIGPAIAQRSYEVDSGFRDRFLDKDGSFDAFFESGREGHYQFDLAGFVCRALSDAGAGAIADLALDTYSDPERFYSYRLSTHRGESTYGRQISVIGLPR
ncbi:peptidoglycan editing factor PgeF [Qipengyuania sp. JC766]|uniref:peptidoglycan editing factor PgeF n=1 Tax=Qipengyuania sp. JC766 TaxID=3232139 RepID=UPI00345AEB27